MLVAVNDPTDVVAADDLRRMLGVTVRVGVASPDAIANAITRIYSGELDFDEEAETPRGDAGATVIDLREAAASAPAIKQVNAVLSRAIELGASDVHFTPQRKRLLVRARVDGVMRELATIPKTLQPAVTSRLKVMAELDIAEKRAPQDGRLSLRTGDRAIDLRVAVLPTTFGEKVTLRIMGSGEAAVSLEELGMSESRRRDARRRRQPALRRRHRRRPDRQRQVHHPARGAQRAQQRRAPDHDDRGSGRVPGAERRPDRGQPARRPDVRQPACARSSARTPT